MRLRLFERLGRLVSWRPGWQGPGMGGPTDPRGDGGDGMRRQAPQRQPSARTARRTAAPAASPRPRPRAAAMRPPATAHEQARRPGLRGDRRRGGGPAPRTSSPWSGRPGAAAAAEELFACRGPRRGRWRRHRPGPDQGGAAVRGRPGGDGHARAGRREPAARDGPEAALVPGCRRARRGRAGSPAGREGAGQERHGRPGAAAGGRPARPVGRRAPGWPATRPRRRCRSPPRTPARPSCDGRRSPAQAVRLRLSCGGSGTPPRPLRPRRRSPRSSGWPSSRGLRCSRSWRTASTASTSAPAECLTSTTWARCTASSCRRARRRGTRAPAPTETARSSWAPGLHRPRT